MELGPNGVGNKMRQIKIVGPKWSQNVSLAILLTLVNISGYPMRSFIELAFSLATSRVSASIQSFSSNNSLNASRIEWIISNAVSLLSELKLSRMNNAPTAMPSFLLVQSVHCAQRWRSDLMPSRIRWNSIRSFWKSSTKCDVKDSKVRHRR